MSERSPMEPTPEQREHLEKFREEHDGDPVGDVGTTLLYEDDDIKIWEMVLAPGQASDLHEHRYPYYMVIQGGDVIAGVTPKGSELEPFVGNLPADKPLVAPRGTGFVEWAYNIGTETYREVLIELKKG